jgi:hypothetical protein
MSWFIRGKQINRFFRLVLCLGFVVASATVQAQDEEADDKPDRNLFAGGTMGLGFGNQTTSIGISPYFGKSINKYIDLAVSLNFNYTSQRDFIELNDKVRQTVYGPGVFARIYPVRFLFAHLQYEYNFIKLKYKPAPGSSYAPEKLSFHAGSILVGPGYCYGRESGSSFYYISVLWDLGKATYSPYLDNYRRAVPIIRAGFHISLNKGHQ